jgi:hypothetical protein
LSFQVLLYYIYLDAFAANSAVQEFASDDNVVFGDMNLQTGCCRKGPNGGDLGAGVGGWPTIRIYNKVQHLKLSCLSSFFHDFFVFF